MDTELGFFVIIAFLLGMGTPLLPRRGGKERRNGSTGRRTGDRDKLEQMYDLLELLVYHHRPPGPDDIDPEDPEDGGP